MTEKELYARSLELEPFRAKGKTDAKASPRVKSSPGPMMPQGTICAVRKETESAKDRVKSIELKGVDKLMVEMGDGLPCDAKEVTASQIGMLASHLQLLSVSFVELRNENEKRTAKLEQQLEEKQGLVDQLLMENENLFSSIIDLQQRVLDLEALAVSSLSDEVASTPTETVTTAPDDATHSTPTPMPAPTPTTADVEDSGEGEAVCQEGSPAGKDVTAVEVQVVQRDGPAKPYEVVCVDD